MHSKRRLALFRRRFFTAIPALASGVFLGYASATVAAEEPAAESGSPAELQEVVVTALKRTQDAVNVPASLTVISAQQLEQSGVVQFEDYARLIPGLASESLGIGQNKLSLRGIPNLGGSAATVSMYLDEVPLTTSDNPVSASNPLAVDIDRVEVLRGPQGTLYGASSMGGTIRVVTRQPSFDAFDAYATAQYSRTDNVSNDYLFQGSVNVPLASELALRLTAVDGENGGYIDHVANPYAQGITTLPASLRASLAETQQNINDERIEGARAQLLWQPVDNVTLLPAIYFEKLAETNQPVIDSDSNGNFQGLINQRSLPQPRSDQSIIYSLTGNITLGWATLTSSSSYNSRIYANTQDFTDFMASVLGNNTAGALSSFVTGAKVTIISHETRLVSDSPNSRWGSVTGIYYNQSSTDVTANLAAPGESAAIGLPPEVAPGDVFFQKFGETNIREFALFEEVSYHFTDKLTGTVGLRWFTTATDFNEVQNGLFAGGALPTSGASDTSGATPKFQLGYKLSEQNLLYVTAAKGYRDGGANALIPTTCNQDLREQGFTSSPTSYNPDSLWNYELGLNSELADRRLIGHVDVFYIKWKDIQLQENFDCGFGFITNAGQASSKGAEMELTALPWRPLTVSIGVGYADARIDQANPGIPNSQDGDPVPGVPKLTYNATAEYRTPFGAQGWGWYVGGDFEHTDQYLSSLGPQSPLTNRPEVNLANFHAGISDAVWTVNLFVKNAFNKLIVVGTQDDEVAGNVVESIIQPPRTVGIAVTWKH